MPKTIVITGSNGFIAKNFIKKLSQDNRKFHLICTYNKTKPQLELNKNSCQIKVNLLDKKSFHKLPKKVYSIFHFASEKNTFVDKSKMNQQFINNAIMCLNIAEYAHNSSVKNLYFSSSVYVYSNNKNELFHEDSCSNPIEILGISKLSSELIFRSWGSFSNIKVFCLRLFTVYGEGSSDSQFIPFAINKIKKSNNIVEFNNGNIKRDFIHISDAINIILSCFVNRNKFTSKFNKINIATGKSYKIKDLIKIISNNLKFKGKVKYLHKKNLRIGDIDHKANISVIKNKLNYKNFMTLNDGIKSIIAHKPKSNNHH